MRGSAELLGSIDYSSSVTLSLIYRAADFDGKRAGFGFLVPKKERQRLAACTFVGTKFSYRVPDDRIVLRCFFGGIGDAAILNESDESVIAIAREELRRILGLTAAPISQTIARWPRSMAQYTLGHRQRVAEIRDARRGDSGAASGGQRLRGHRHSGLHPHGAARPLRRRSLLYRDANAVRPELDALDIIAQFKRLIHFGVREKVEEELIHQEVQRRSGDRDAGDLQARQISRSRVRGLDSSCMDNFERPLALDQFRDQRIGGQPLALPHLEKIDERGTGGGAHAELDAGLANALVHLRNATASPRVHFGGREDDDGTGRAWPDSMRSSLLSARRERGFGGAER